MENARELDEKLRRIIREISRDTGSEIKRDLMRELAAHLENSQNREMHRMLETFNRALKKIN